LVPVATDVGDCRLMIGDTGFIAPAGDVDALAAALARAAQGVRDGGGAAARARVLDRFALAHALDAFRGAYCGLVGLPCAA
jgi:glycosyltransferase involved in cell wall biosynthesis